MYRSVDPESVVRTVERLRDRIEERLPGSGLSGVARELLDVARNSAARAMWTAKPLLPLRAAMVLLVGLMVAGLWAAASSLRLSTHVQSLVELVQAIESSINDLVFAALAVYFIGSIENRIKRSRVLAALHELRSLAHIIDMHQLTKDPDRAMTTGVDTRSSPGRPLSRFELGRYLDYCSEMLALIGKIAALYAQYTNDAVALQAVDQIEDLTSGLSQKIWQKLIILHQLPGHEVAQGSATD